VERAPILLKIGQNRVSGRSELLVIAVMPAFYKGLAGGWGGGLLSSKPFSEAPMPLLSS